MKKEEIERLLTLDARLGFIEGYHGRPCRTSDENIEYKSVTMTLIGEYTDYEELVRAFANAVIQAMDGKKYAVWRKPPTVVCEEDDRKIMISARLHGSDILKEGYMPISYILDKAGIEYTSSLEGDVTAITINGVSFYP